MNAIRCHGPNCKGNSPLVRSHIIPKWAFRPLKAESSRLRTYLFEDRSYLRQCGEWDDRILCEECENRLSAIDAFGEQVTSRIAAAVQSRPITNRYRQEFMEIQFDELEGLDPIEIERFAVSVLWRASISNRPVVHDFSLAAIEGHLARHVYEAFEPGKFPCLLEWVDPDGDIDPQQFVWYPKQFDSPGGMKKTIFMAGGITYHTFLTRPLMNDYMHRDGAPRSAMVISRRPFGSRGEYSAIEPWIRERY